MGTGNIFSAEDLAKNFEGVDDVVSTLGFSLLTGSVTGYSGSTKAMLDALKTVPCNRLLLMHSWCSKRESRFVPESRSVAAIFDWFFVNYVIGRVLDDMDRAEEI